MVRNRTCYYKTFVFFIKKNLEFTVTVYKQAIIYGMNLTRNNKSMYIIGKGRHHLRQWHSWFENVHFQEKKNCFSFQTQLCICLTLFIIDPSWSHRWQIPLTEGPIPFLRGREVAPCHKKMPFVTTNLH